MLTPVQEFVISAYNEGAVDSRRMQELKTRFAAGRGSRLFSNVELIEAYRELVKTGDLPDDVEFLKNLRKRGVRSMSGIASVTVITKAHPCPGKCIYCPSEPGMPSSYLSNEPAIMRAILNDFDPYKQTLNRLSGLDKSGHHTDKIDVIVSGGTFSFYPKRYGNDFTRGIFNALNFPLPKARSLDEAQKRNEKALHRCIGLSFETRPDHITEKELIRLRTLGCTKIEIGVQSLNDRVLKMNGRGHGVAETRRAMQLMKDAGFKVNCHIMPGLYGSNPENDYNDFAELFENPAYRPDWLKIYPCMVVPWTKLEKIYKAGKYIPYTDDEVMDLVIKIKQIVPKYCRITRLYRDIPAPTVIGGTKVSNLRQLAQEKMRREGLKCSCIRCREIKDQRVNFKDLSLDVMEMDASRGREFFITFEDLTPGKDGQSRDKLASLLRLRFSSYSLSGVPHFIKELEGAALIREVHAYGRQVPVSGQEKGSSQHIGLGRRMIEKAEEITRKNGYGKIAVISGIGVREYYRKLGYRLEGTYMVKNL